MTMTTAAIHHCPLCSLEFGDASGCHTSCPMSAGCGMIKCPRCDYEFVEQSSIVNFVRRLFGRSNAEEPR